ncbi:MAG: hypothetical protein QNJ60_16680 [Xenococcaceae cyanobacterium MO_188.B19]|nr:hypothetical protein [Xenococcaceae cyanobacterium MO_188.B19]
MILDIIIVIIYQSILAFLINLNKDVEEVYKEGCDRENKLILKLQLPLSVEATSLEWRSTTETKPEVVYKSNTSQAHPLSARQFVIYQVIHLKAILEIAKC